MRFSRDYTLVGQQMQAVVFICWGGFDVNLTLENKMIERELIFLLTYTAAVSGAVWFTWRFRRELWSGKYVVLAPIITVAWGLYLVCFGIGGGTPIQLWMDYLEAHGVLYTSGALK